MVAPRGIFGAGTVTGSGNINGSALTTYSVDLTATGGSFAGAFFTYSTMEWYDQAPANVTNHWTVGEVKVLTVSGLTGGYSNLNGETFGAIYTGTQLIPYPVNGIPGLDTWIQVNGITNAQINYPNFTISWNA
jgi:hypothetical protein